ncbi:MAG: DUF2125 domain-containing protein [Alphaproteobacteria bacterium]|nr:DUF2125 domain-containing protein [Alphaproteobacteria bacterium]
MPRPLRIAALTLAVLAGFYTAGWMYLSARFAEGVGFWLDGLKAEGIAVARKDIAAGGFPFRLEARLTEPKASFAAGRKTVEWTPARAVFSARPWSPDRVTLDLSGAHDIALGGGRWRAEAARLAAAAHLKGSGPVALDLELGRLAVAGQKAEGQLGVESLRLRWRRAAQPPADHTGESHAFEIALEGLRLPERARLPLGSDVAAAKIAGRVLGELSRLTPGMGAGALGPWRDGGGTVELSAVEARYGALAVAGEGTLALDGAMQPLASLTARIEGFAAALDMLAQRGQMKPGDATAAKLVLSALAKKGPGGRPRLALPVTVQDGLLFVGPAMLLRLPPIPW